MVIRKLIAKEPDGVYTDTGSVDSRKFLTKRSSRSPLLASSGNIMTFSFSNTPYYAAAMIAASASAKAQPSRARAEHIPQPFLTRTLQGTDNV
jgi:hypothetical protein